MLARSRAGKPTPLADPSATVSVDAARSPRGHPMSEPTEQTRSRPLPGLGGFRIAWRQLLGGDDVSPVDISAVYYPAIGLFLGVCMASLDRFLTPDTPVVVASAVIVGFHALATRGRPLTGLARTACRFIAAPLSRSPLAVVVTTIALLLLSIWIVQRIDGGRFVALLFAPMLGRCAMVVMATGSREARDDDRQLKFSRELTFREFGIASTAAFALVFTTTNFLGLLLVLVTGIATIALRLILHWRLGGVDRASLHGCGEFVQLAVLGLMAAL